MSACREAASWRRSRGERGQVTAETAIVLPVLVGVAALLTWLVGAGIAQVRCVDAARDAARALARDEPPAAVVAAARDVAPDGAVVEVTEGAGRVQVRVRFTATPPGDWLDGALALPLGSTATLPVEVGP